MRLGRAPGDAGGHELGVEVGERSRRQVVGVVGEGLGRHRVAPDRDAPKIRWVSVGAGIATVLWIVASVGFSIYVSQFGSYAKTYGAIAGIVILLLWLFITAYAILLGAEINAESEQQTVADTTKGEPQPIGERDAVKADSIPTDGEAAGREDADDQDKARTR